jgi:hypothetical protein
MGLCGGGGSDRPDPVKTEVIETPQEIKDYYRFLKEVGADQWERYKEKYGPIEDRLIKETERFQTQAYADEQAGMAGSDVTKAFAAQRQADDARMASFGLDPSQNKSRSMRLNANLAEAGTQAAAETSARRNAGLTGFNALAGTAGRGDAKVGQALAGGQAALAGAQNAHNTGVQQGQFNSQMGYNIWAQNQQRESQGLAGLGSLAGTIGTLAFMSSKKAKHTKRGEYKGGLSAIEKMPVKRWKYKPEASTDGAEHVGPMAEDFAKHTGLGDGKTIHVADAHGITVSAIKEMNERLKKLEHKKPHVSDPTSEANQPEGAEA